MEATREAFATLEGQRVRVEAGACYFEDYNFRYDNWELRESAPWPLGRETAATWVAGWNRVDRFAAFKILV
jgi:hypothetical protein